MIKSTIFIVGYIIIAGLCLKALHINPAIFFDWIIWFLRLIQTVLNYIY